MAPKLYNPFLQVAVCLLLVACNGYSQNKVFVYKAVPDHYSKNIREHKYKYNANDSTIFDITLALPRGYVTNGTADYTACLQSALNRYPRVFMPDFPVMVNDSGLTVNTGQTIIFKDSSKLILKASTHNTYEILRIHGVENVSVYSAVIYGDKATHTGTDGQWGMGIAVRASRNITIINPKVYKCWGDGIYIGGIKNVPSQNVAIYAPLLDDNRRNGISVTSVKQLIIVGGVIANSNGQMPQSGIDIEPNRPTDVIDNISISDVVTYNHPKYGIVISLQQLRGRMAGETNIVIKNSVDEGSGNGLAIVGKPSNDTLSGKIIVMRPVYINDGDTPIKLPLRTYGIRLHINRLLAGGINKDDLDRLRTAIKKQPEIRID